MVVILIEIVLILVLISDLQGSEVVIDGFVAVGGVPVEFDTCTLHLTRYCT